MRINVLTFMRQRFQIDVEKLKGIHNIITNIILQIMLSAYSIFYYTMQFNYSSGNSLRKM